MSIVRTVCSDIPLETLGVTSMHEHTIMSTRVMKDILVKSASDMFAGAKCYQGGADIGMELARRARERLPPGATDGHAGGNPESFPSREPSGHHRGKTRPYPGDCKMMGQRPRKRGE